MQSYSETTQALAGLLQHSVAEHEGVHQSDYWNIEDILAENEMVPTVFKFDSAGLGHLAQIGKTKGEKQHRQVAQLVKQDTKMDLPLWLAIVMSTRGIVDLMKPLYLTPKYFQKLKAGADVVSMHTQSPYVFEIMMKLCALYPDDTVIETTQVFIQAFIERFKNITLDYSLAQTSTDQGVNNASSDQFTTAVKRLTNFEREIFDLHKTQKIKVANWRRKSNALVEVNMDMLDHETRDSLKRMKHN